MARSFNTTGPCLPDEHYMLPPERRLSRILELIEARKYFVIRAGRQTGKTTSARWLVKFFNQGQRLRCTWIDLQTARDQPDPQRAFRTVLNKMKGAVQRDLPDLPLPDVETLLRDPSTAILTYLTQLSAAAPLPLLVLFDEADCLVGETLVLFLTQLRDGYIGRSDAPFPHSLALIGARSVRDYVLSQEDRRAVAWLGTSSPFNITAEAATLAPFTAAEVVELCQQHTADTGQRFLPEATALVFELSQGHPWLVNALCDFTVDRERDRTVAITAADVEAAKEGMIIERRTHIDSLIARLAEPRVRRIVEPMLIGGRATGSADVLHDDFAYVLGLGLIALRGGEYVIANPIYKEVIPRVLSFDQQAQLHLKPAAFLLPDGRLDMARLMKAWQEFWREDGHLAAEGFTYREAGPHLMLMAFLQRIINGGGRIEREYALGRGALDLMIEFAGERHAIEIKLRRDTRTRELALAQLGGYLDEAGLPMGWLVIFDLRKEVPWTDKLTLEEVVAEGRRIWMVGC
jgi:hypothetical protein